MTPDAMRRERGTETTATALDRGRWHGPVTVKRPDGRVDIDRHAKGRKGDHCVYGAMDGAGTAGDYPSVTHPAAPPARKYPFGSRGTEHARSLPE